MGTSGFFKGEKKKKKQHDAGSKGSYAPVFIPPRIMGKGKKES